MRRFDLLIVGAGQGSAPLARAFSEAGRSVAVAERDLVGGSCVNWGCTPTKTYAASARVAHLARRAADFGVHASPPAVSLREVKARKDRIVADFRAGTTKAIEALPRVELLRGDARFVGERRLAVGREAVEAETVVLDTGSRPKIPAIPGLNDVPYLTSRTLLDLEDLPPHLVVLGGGYIGLEYAQTFRRFGSRVTVIEGGERVLSREDPDVTDAIEAFLKAEGIAIEFCRGVRRVEGTGDGVAVELEGRTVSGTHLLVATNQCPNVELLDLPAGGVETTEAGYVKVDARLGTTAEGVYALGDVKGGPAFTHVAYDDHRILRDNLLRGGSRTTEGREVPSCVFTDPQLGRIGLSETEAKRAGISYRLAKLPMTELGRPIERGETDGFVKALVHPDTDRILGAACLCVDGGEVMALFQLAMKGGLTAGDLRESTLAHPTMAEGLNNLFLAPE